MDKRLYISDLDGTLLMDDSTLSAFSAKTLNALLDAGVAITFASARSKSKILELLNGVRMGFPYIALNGAQLVDAATGKVIRENLIPEQLVSKVLDISGELGLSPFIVGEQESLDIITYTDKQNRMMKEFVSSRPEDNRFHCSPNSIFIPPKMYVLNFLGEKDTLSVLESKLQNSPFGGIRTTLMKDFYLEGCYSLEVRERNSEKSIMVHTLCESMGFGVDDVCYFGDELNDLAIFDVVGTKVAVSNANELVKAKADVVIGSNQSDGVARYLSKLHQVAD